MYAGKLTSLALALRALRALGLALLADPRALRALGAVILALGSLPRELASSLIYIICYENFQIHDVTTSKHHKLYGLGNLYVT